MGLLLKQFQYLEERHGADLAILRFRKMAHWYVKGMRVRASLRHQLQLAQTRSEFEAAIEAIRQAGPIGGDRLNELPALQVPVPSGPNERW